MSERLRVDLKVAMRARYVLAVIAIRALLAAIDNAQAVPVGQERKPWVRNRFGEDAVEVPRLRLSPDDLASLLGREIENRRRVAAEVRPFGRDEEADRALAEAEVIQRYREG